MFVQLRRLALENVLGLALARLLPSICSCFEPDYVLDHSLEVLLLALSHLRAGVSTHVVHTSTVTRHYNSAVTRHYNSAVTRHLLQCDLVCVPNAVLAQEIELERVHGRGGHLNVFGSQRAAANLGKEREMGRCMRALG